MADNNVSACMEQRVVMRFLVNEGVKPADIYRRLQAQYGDETLGRSKTFEWCKRFKDGRTSISDDPYCLLPTLFHRHEHPCLSVRGCTCYLVKQFCRHTKSLHTI